MLKESAKAAKNLGRIDGRHMKCTSYISFQEDFVRESVQTFNLSADVTGHPGKKSCGQEETITTCWHASRHS